MALKVDASFSTGELDPALHERTTFDKFKSGLATLRNCLVGKSGRIISRSGRLHVRTCSLTNREVLLFSPPFSNYIIEWGHLYVRVINVGTGLTSDAVHTLTESDLPEIQFEISGNFCYVFCYGTKVMKFDYTAAGFITFVADAVIFYTPALAVHVSDGTVTGAGYDVDYVATYVVNGQESAPSATYAGLKLPITAGTLNYMQFKTPVGMSLPSEFRLYRRPKDGGAFGFIGSSVDMATTGGYYYSNIKDVGQDADYTHTPPVQNPVVAPIDFKGRTGTIYKQRMVMSQQTNKEAIDASRPGFQNNFYRDSPLSSDSALTFKCGTGGNAEVLRLIEHNGLVAFTTRGPFLHQGALSPTNLEMENKGNWVINYKVPPLKVPGGLLFVDKSTNTVRSLTYSTEGTAFAGEELSIFSNHLFVGKTVKSWAFQDGDIPVVWVVFSDGSLVALTYQPEHQMRAWHRHDTDGLNYEQVTVVTSAGAAGVAYFVVEKDGVRYIEKTTPRTFDDIKDWVGMDSAVTAAGTRNAGSGGVNFTIAPDDTENPDGDWSGILRLEADGAAFLNVPGDAEVGYVFRFFDSEGCTVDLEVTEYIDTVTILVQPSTEFPSDEGEDITLYETFTTVSGLSHLNGESVMVHVDGAVVASPNNDKESYPEVLVGGGQITLPSGLRGAIVHVGRPFTADVETLNIDTVEQRPTLIESMIVNKLYVALYKALGMFAGAVFPDDDKVAAMEDMEVLEINQDSETELIANRCDQPFTGRKEQTISGDWQSNGKVCFRNVDGLPFEILSIIPDVEDLRR